MDFESAGFTAVEKPSNCRSTNARRIVDSFIESGAECISRTYADRRELVNERGRIARYLKGHEGVHTKVDGDTLYIYRG